MERGRSGAVSEPVRREVMIAAPPEAVWEALTDAGELAAWFGAEADVDVRPGGPVHFRWADGSERRGLVVEVDAPRRLVFRWRELRRSRDGLTMADATVVVFTLEREHDATRLTVTESPGLTAADPPLAMAERGR
jgi:uncharacterized protein YndB with AHSA1/START domain